MATSSLPTRLINTLTSHTAPVNAITFSSLGGTYILTGSSDRQIHLSRTEPSDKTDNDKPTLPIQEYASHGYPVLDIAVSRDNQLFASVGGDRSVFLWAVQNSEGTLRRLGSNTTQGHTSRINCVALTGADDSVLVSGGDDRSVRLWDMKSKDTKPLMVMEEARDGVSDLSIPESGYEIVAGSVDGRVRSYDIRMGSVTSDVMPGSVTSVEVSRDGKTVLVGCLDSKIRVVDRKDGAVLRTFPGEGGGNGYMNESLRLKSCFAVNEALVLSGSEADGLMRAWDVLSGKCMAKVEVNSAVKVVSVVKWREGSQAQGRQGVWAAGGAEGTVRIYAT